MHIKIYFNDKPLFLCDAITEELEPYRHHDDAVYIDELNTHTVKSMLHEMQLDKVHAGIFYHPDLAELKKAFWRKFTIIQAGGGLVENSYNEILVIFRRGKWDLPKGKLDEGETIEQCAVREVEEECGLTNIQLGPLLLTTYHTYNESGKAILKESHWYKMKVPGSPQLVPQTAEDIHEVKWIAKKGFTEIMANTFPSIKDVLALY
ncbi:MAG: hypothetical protein RLZZ316_892 [Bacteroidota bacterium]